MTHARLAGTVVIEYDDVTDRSVHTTAWRRMNHPGGGV